MNRLRRHAPVADVVARYASSPAAIAPSERIVPDVPITRWTLRRASCRRKLRVSSIDVAHEAALVAPRQRIGLREAFGEPDHAELEAAPELHARRRAERDLGAAAADVDHDRGLAADVDRVGRGEMDEPRLLGAGDDAHADADVAMHGGEEVRAVLGFADRARGRGDDLVDAVGFGQPLELRQRLHRGRDARDRQLAPVEAARAQAYHVAFHDRRPRTRDPAGCGRRSCGSNWCRRRWPRCACVTQ